MIDLLVIISVIASTIIIISFFQLKSSIHSIERIIKQPNNLKHKTIAKIISNASDSKETALEFLTEQAHYYRKLHPIEKLPLKIETRYQRIISMTGITSDEVKECCKLIH